MSVGLTRREVLRFGVGGAAALCAPLARGQARPRLRVIGTHTTLQEPIRRRAEQDLGITIEYRPMGSAAAHQLASTRPDAFDVCEYASGGLRLLWHTGALRAIDPARIARWDAINGLTKTGRVAPGAPLGAGEAPYRMLYVQRDGSLGSTPTGEVSFVPFVHNADSFGYDTRAIPKGRAYEDESWGWLLDPARRGRVALANKPPIGLIDAAMAAQARGLATFGDIGAMTRAEVGALMDLLVERKRDGHFAGFWNSAPEAVRFMRTGRVVIESLFSPGVATLNGLGTPAVYAAPREGYRGWHGAMCLSASASDEATDAAYRYMNWWLSGWAGAFVARQGYYVSIPELAKQHLSAPEWAYWYGGEPATAPLRGTDGRLVVQPGAVRNGGSYEERMSRIAVWNTFPEAYEYTLERWGELLHT